MILVIDNYDSFTFNLYQAFEMLGHKTKVVRNDELTLGHIEKLAPQAIVLSPGSGRPDSAGITLSAIKYFAGRIPMLGVCLGHQAIGQAFGANVVKATRLMHGKTSRVFHDGRGIYRRVEKPFTATRYHSLVIERESLPNCLRVVAETEDGVVMGVRHSKYAIEGVQFHPESILTKAGEKLFANFFEEAL